MGPVFAGIAIGTALAFVAVQWLASLLYGVRPTDPATFLGGVMALVAVSSAATVLPIWRAAAANIVSVLRDE